MFAWLSTGPTKAEFKALQHTVHDLRRSVAELSTKISTTAGAQLAIRCGELEAALETLQKSNRREFGRLWKLLPDTPKEPAAEPETPEQVRARLRSEHNLPRVGGIRSVE